MFSFVKFECVEVVVRCWTEGEIFVLYMCWCKMWKAASKKQKQETIGQRVIPKNKKATTEGWRRYGGSCRPQQGGHSPPALSLEVQRCSAGLSHESNHGQCILASQNSTWQDDDD